MSDSLERVLREADHVLVATHVSPDPDGIGSLLAAGRLLDRLQVPHTLVSQDGLPYDADFLPGVETVITEAPERFDVAVVLDCSEPRRIGAAADRLADSVVVNIDHHITNTGFGNLNRVDLGALSTCQIVYRLAGELGLSLDGTTATCLLAGLVADTQGFRIPATDRRALEDAAALVAAGADLATVSRGVFGSRPAGHIALWGRVLSRAALSEGVVSAQISLADRWAAGIPEEDDAGIVNFLHSTRGTLAAAVFSEQSNGKVSVSLRSVPGVDVAAVAVAYGGGGHRQAAGCSVSGTLADVSKLVLADVKRALNGSALGRGSH